MNEDRSDLHSLTERVINLERTLNSFLLQEPDAPTTLTANRFVLRDSNGVERGLISAPNESSAALLLFDSKGTTQLFAGVEEQGPTIALYDAKETPRVKLTVNESMNGSAISIHDSNGTTQISIVSLEGEPVRMSIHDSNGLRRADLLYVEDNDDVRGAALALKDSSGKVRVMVSDRCVAVMDSDEKLIFMPLRRLKRSKRSLSHHISCFIKMVSNTVLIPLSR